tara:strand:+ start:53 stop:580 length:528 start_codon:yes stop_codon:yes gene_type:complete
MNRKQILKWCVFFLLVTGVLLSFIPFIKSLNPAAGVDKPLEIDISAIPKGVLLEFEHNGKPLVIYKATDKYAQDLISINHLTNGPYYKAGELPEFFVYYRMSTFKNCYLYTNQENEHPESFGPVAGLYDPCHMGFWDFSGRHIKGVNTPSGKVLNNLEAVGNYKWRKKGVIWFPK